MNRRLSKIHFLTSYCEYLLRRGVRNENDHIGDASRFLRFLLSQVDADVLELFYDSCNASAGYRRRLKHTLGRFFTYSQQCLGIQLDLCEEPSRNR